MKLKRQCLRALQSLTKILEGRLLIFAKQLEMDVPVEHLMNLCPGDHFRIRDVAVECLVKPFHIRICHLEDAIDLRWRGDVHVPGELRRRGHNGEERQTLQPCVIGEA
jgi:hypothetical protein